MDYRNDPLYKQFLQEEQQLSQAQQQPQTPQLSKADLESQEYKKILEEEKQKDVLSAREKLSRSTRKSGIKFIDDFVQKNVVENDFMLGAAKNYYDYGASGAKLFGATDLQKRLSDKSHTIHKAIDNEWVGMAGEMLADPINLAPAGIFTQGTKAARVAKSMAGGAAVGAGTMFAKDYGNDRLTQEQKNLNMGIGAGFVAGINGIIAGVTKGRVTNAIDADVVGNKNADEIADAIMGNYDDLGISKVEAEAITGEILKYPKMQDEFRVEQAGRPQKPYEPNFQMRPNHPPVPMDKQTALNIIFKKENEEAIARGEAPRYPQVQEQFRTESLYPEQPQQPYTPDFVSGDFNRNMPTPYSDTADLERRYQKIAAHPRLQELLQMREGVSAKDAQSPTRNTDNGYFAHENNGNGWETTKVAPNRETNYNYDFHLTKQDIAKLYMGKHDENLINKLESDLHTLDNHPEWSKQAEPTDFSKMTQEDWDEANALFSKGIDNVAVGTYAGIEQDENGNITFDPEKFIIGLGGYTAVKQALKNKQVQGKLKEYAQRAVDMIDMSPQVHKERGFNAMFVGANKSDTYYRGIKPNGKQQEPLTWYTKEKSLADEYSYTKDGVKGKVLERELKEHSNPLMIGNIEKTRSPQDFFIELTNLKHDLWKQIDRDTFDNLSTKEMPIYEILRDDKMLEFIKKAGFDGVEAVERGKKTVAYFDDGIDTGSFSDIATKQTMREIDDSNINYKPIPKQNVEMDGVIYEQNYANLGDIIDHPELFKKYPELKDLQVSINDRGGRGGSYNRGIGAIALDRGNVRKVVSDEEKAIRAQIRELDANPIDAEYAKLNAKFIDEATPAEELQAIDEAISKTPTAQKMQELQTQLYKAIDDADKSAKGAKDLTDYGKGTLLHEVQHSIQEREKWARGGNVEEFERKKVINDAQLKYEEDNFLSWRDAEEWNKYKNGKIKYEDTIASFIDEIPESEYVAKMQKLEKEKPFYAMDEDYIKKHLDEATERYNNAYAKRDSESSGDKYLRLHGEQQARATQYRKDMTPEQRAGEAWTDTLIRKEGEYKEPIVKYDGDVAMMSSTRAEKIIHQLKDEIDYKKLPKEQQDIYDVYIGNRSVAEIKSNDLDDVINFEYGSKKQGARKIIVKHGGTDAVGGLSPDELVNVANVIRNGKIADDSFSETRNSIRYGYDSLKNDIKFRVVVEEFDDGRKVINYYSDRNFVEADKGAHSLQSTPNETIIPQNQREVDIVNMRDFKKRIAGKEEDIQRLVKSYAYAKSRHPEKVYRGVADENNLINNSSGASSEGYGLYTTMNKNLAQDYGKVIELNGKDATPKNPLAFSDYNQYEIFMQQLMYKIAGYKRASEYSAINQNEILNTLFPDRDGIQIGTGKRTFWVKFPDINEVREKQKYEVLFANAGHSMAGGFAGGSDALINQRDYDGDGETTYKDILAGVGAGVAGIHGVKKVAPKLFDDGAEGGVKAGLFAGSKAKGYDAKAQAGKTFEGKYDGMERFEIDDSIAKITSPKELNDKVKKRYIADADRLRERYESGELPEDEAMRLLKKNWNDMPIGKNGTHHISDALKHPELYENYPRLYDTKVTFTDMPSGAKGYYDSTNNEIVISSALSDKEIKSALLHEIQHAIQKQEGFARGGSAQEFYNDAKNKIELLKYELEFEPDDFIRDRMMAKLQKLEQTYQTKGKEEAFEMYQKLAGEIEARDVQARMDYTPKQREKIAPYSSENIARDDAILKFDNGSDEIRGKYNQMSEEAPKKNDGNFVDKLIRDGVAKGAKTIDDIFGNKISNAYKDLKEKEIVDDIFGHKIYEKKEYMKWRDDALREREERGIELENLHKKLSKLPSQTRSDLYDYMTGNKDVPLSPALKALGEKYIKEIDDRGSQLVGEGVLSQEAFDTWKGSYLKRRYSSKIGSAKNAFHQVKGKTIDPVNARGKIWEGTEAELAKLEADGMIGSIADGKVEAQMMPDGKVQFRRDWTPEERAKMGEIKDASYSIPDTLSHLDEMIAHAKLLRKTAGKYILDAEQASKLTDMQIKNSGFVKLEGAKYGALNGQYVDRSIANDIQELDRQLNGTDSAIKEATTEYFKWYKAIHTIYNPKTHFNNLMSNLVGFAFMEGRFGKTAGTVGKEIGKAVFPTSISTKGKADAFIELQARESVGTITDAEAKMLNTLRQDKDVALWMEARKAGLYGKGRLNDVLNTYLQPRMKKVDGAGQKIHQKAGEVYQFEDDVVRFALFKQFKDEGYDTAGAVREVGKIIPDYSKPMSRAANFLRRYGIAPFIAFPYYATPIMMRQIAQRPSRPIAIAATIYGLYQAQGMDMFDEEDAPERFRKSYAPFMKSGDKTYGVKYDRWLPHLDLLKIHKMPIDILKSSPYASAFGVAVGLADNNGGYDPYFGGKITYNKGLEGIYDIGKKATQGFITPDIVDGGLNLIASLAASEKKRKTNPVYNPKNTGQSILDVLGLNTTSFNRSAQRKKYKSEQMKK